MTTTQHVVRVHPQTVTNYSTSGGSSTPGRGLLCRKHRQVRDNARSEASEMTHTITDRALWAWALEQVDGDARRIEIIDESHVMIHNNPGWRRR